MRLFDKCCTMTGLRQRYPEIAQMNVLCADAIANYYADTPVDFWGSDKYPYARPCWSEFFVEWNQPSSWNRHGGRFDGTFGMQQAGLMGVVFDKPQMIREKLRELDGLESKYVERAELLVASQPIAFIEGRVYLPDCRAYWVLRNDGWVVVHFVHGPAVDECNPDDAKKLSQSLGTFDHIAMLAFTFANCSNVKLEDATEELQPIAKLRRRLKIPEVKRYTLNIAGHVSRPSRDYNEGPKGVMPFHLCRGHFATYTADRPMFGNPKLVGRYWHPPHMKGKKENGEIVKDYAIA